MKQVDQPARRHFLRTASALAGALMASPLLPALAETPAAETALLHVHAGGSGQRISPQLVGLSYETLQLQDPTYFSDHDDALLAFLHTLNPDGVLRVGGNSSDFAVWSEYQGPLRDFLSGPPAASRQPHLITPAQIARLAAFLRASGWRLIFGLNLRADLPEMAAQLAEAVQRAAGDYLLAFQLGNEPDDYVGENGLRIGFDAYFERWQRTAQAVRQRVPAVPIAGPDTGAHSGWVTAFAEQARSVVALTRHYYRGGAPEPTSTIAQLLGGDPGFMHELAGIHAVTTNRGLPFILSEVNSYWGGGKQGVSDTFAAALWSGDFTLACAQAGVQSLDFHGGGLQVLETALDKNAAAPSSHGNPLDRIDAISGLYAPIAGDAVVGFYGRPLYYGMLLAQQFANARFVDCTLRKGAVNLTAYAATRGSQRMLALFNKDLQHDAELRVSLDRPAARARTWRLQAPSIETVHHTTFAGAQVGPDGYWAPQAGESTVVVDAEFTLSMPRASAALVWLDT